MYVQLKVFTPNITPSPLPLSIKTLESRGSERLLNPKELWVVTIGL